MNASSAEFKPNNNQQRVNVQSPNLANIQKPWNNNKSNAQKVPTPGERQNNKSKKKKNKGKLNNLQFTKNPKNQAPKSHPLTTQSPKSSSSNLHASKSSFPDLNQSEASPSKSPNVNVSEPSPTHFMHSSALLEEQESPKPKDPKEEYDMLMEEYQDVWFNKLDNDDVKFKRICQLMKELNYPYNGLYQFCGQVFDKYIQHEGINDDDFFIDVPYIIQAAIEDDVSFNWNLFISKLSICTFDFRHRELYLTRIKNFKCLIDAYKLGFIDHRLERAIINMQRHLRKQEPDQASSIKLGIKLNNIKQIKHIPYSDNLDHQHILDWNKHLIFDHIKDYLYHTETYLYVSNEIEGLNLSTLKQHLLDELENLIPKDFNKDHYTKFFELSNCYLEDRFDAWRDYQRDVLKFVYLAHKGDPQKLKLCMIERVFKYTPTVRKLLFDKMKTSLGSHGSQIINEFVRKDIDKATIDDLKYWFMQMILEPLNELAFDEKLLQKFLKHEVNPEIIRRHQEIIDFLRNLLKERQTALRTRSFTYKLKHGYYLPEVTYVMYY